MNGSKSKKHEQLMDCSIDDLDLNIRTINNLRVFRCVKIKDILDIETKEFMESPHFGSKSLNVLRFELAKYDLYLKNDPFWTLEKLIALDRQKPTYMQDILGRLEALEKRIN